MNLVDEEDWIRVVGTISKGVDGPVEYLYIEASSVEKLEERGQEQVY